LSAAPQAKLVLTLENVITIMALLHVFSFWNVLQVKTLVSKLQMTAWAVRCPLRSAEYDLKLAPEHVGGPCSGNSAAVAP
jgi:hypothetical protein